jgi:hypothetical protein
MEYKSLIIYVVITLILIFYSVSTFKDSRINDTRFKVFVRLLNFFYFIPLKIMVLLFVFFGYFTLFKYLFENWLFKEIPSKKKSLFPPLLVLNEIGFLFLIIIYMLFNMRILLILLFSYMILLLFTSLIGKQLGYSFFPYKSKHNIVIGMLIALAVMIILSLIIPIIEYIILFIIYFEPYNLITIQH